MTTVTQDVLRGEFTKLRNEALRRKEGRTLYLRKATPAELAQPKICTALGLDPQSGTVSRMVV